MNLIQVRELVARAALKAGRDPGGVKLVAVTKTVPVEIINQAVAAGVTTVGENRVQEILDKQPQLPAELEWHLIGTLQTNKVKAVLDKVRLIHSLDRWRLAEEISRRATGAGFESRVLVQVNISGEGSKSGLAPEELNDFLRDACALPGLKITGLMTMAPYAANPEEARPVFRKLRLLAGKIKDSYPGVRMDYLSMGMTNDFTVAVEEGANIIRVGTAIFGTRIY